MALPPNKLELAQWKAESEMGSPPMRIGKKHNRDYRTVKKYIERLEVFIDPEIRQIVDTIKQKEKEDLYILNQKARARLHELLDEGKLRAIETTAIVDRTFQQRRILEGATTEHVAHHHIVSTLKAAQRELQQIMEELDND